MENKTVPLYMLVFCYAVFSFAVYIPDSKMNLYSWLKILCVALVFKVIFLFLIRNGRNLKPISKIFETYAVFLLSFQTNKIFRYLRLYHNRNAEAIIIITILTILIFVVFADIKLYRFSRPLFIFSVIFIATMVVLNINKVNVYNLFAHNKLTDDIKISSITLFDYIIPMCLIENSIKRDDKYKSIKVVSAIDLLLICMIFFVYFCFKGDLVYSISPLQLIFQLSGGEYIRNFDALYSFMLIMLYFASVILIFWSIKAVRRNNSKIKYGILLPYIAFLYISFYIEDTLLLLIHMTAAVLFLGGRNIGKN